jgi:hypothetical protein
MFEGMENAKMEQLEKDIAIISKKVLEVANITSPEEEARAAEFGKQIKLRIAQAEDARKFLVKPMNDHVKRINDTFKVKTVPLNEALDFINNGLRAWRNSEEVRLAKEAAEKAKVEVKVAVATGNLEQMHAEVAKAKEAQAIAPTKVQTQSGKMSYRKVWRYEIQDPLSVPAAYWAIDEKKIAETIKQGVNIEGVKSWQEDTPIYS